MASVNLLVTRRSVGRGQSRDTGKILQTCEASWDGPPGLWSPTIPVCLKEKRGAINHQCSPRAQSVPGTVGDPESQLENRTELAPAVVEIAFLKRYPKTYLREVKESAREDRGWWAMGCSRGSSWRE